MQFTESHLRRGSGLRIAAGEPPLATGAVLVVEGDRITALVVEDPEQAERLHAATRELLLQMEARRARPRLSAVSGG